MPPDESVEEAWLWTVRTARRDHAIRAALGGILVGLGAGLAAVNGDASYFAAHDCPAAGAKVGCAAPASGFPFFSAALVAAGVFLACWTLPFVGLSPAMPDRSRLEAPLGRSQAVWERLPLRHRMRSHLSALGRNLATVRLAIVSLLLSVAFALMILVLANHGGLEAASGDISCRDVDCPAVGGSPAVQDLTVTTLVGIAMVVALVKCMRRAVQPVTAISLKRT